MSLKINSASGTYITKNSITGSAASMAGWFRASGGTELCYLQAVSGGLVKVSVNGSNVLQVETAGAAQTETNNVTLTNGNWYFLFVRLGGSDAGVWVWAEADSSPTEVISGLIAAPASAYNVVIGDPLYNASATSSYRFWRSWSASLNTTQASAEKSFTPTGTGAGSAALTTDLTVSWPLATGSDTTDWSGGSNTPTLTGTFTTDASEPTIGPATPTITGPTGSATGNTTANAGATIDTVSGSGSRILYALPRVGGSAASAATIIATGTQLAVTSSGAKSVPLTGLTNGSAYSADLVYVDATLGESNVVTATWTQTAAPVLSSPTNTPGSTTALIGATTTVTSGTAYFLARVGGSAAVAATIIATGQTSTVTTTTPSRTVTGLTASTANYYVDIVQVSGVTTSNVVSAGSFTTSASGDTTPPTLTGSIVIGTVSSTTIQISWPAGSDNVGVTSYEVSSSGGSSYTDVGNVLTYTFTGLTASTSYGLRVRAKDAAGNVSSPALSSTQSTAAASGVGSISLNNAALYVFKRNNTTTISSTAVTFWVSDITSGALIGTAITGLSTNSSGLVTTSISNASMTAGVTYRLNYEFGTGEYGVVKLPAV